ncbi:2-keto-4-pentenoate hydratase [Singulisphaera sp. GP187]|uniref:2-keto-4-pentenoate hydratase n=1 Tax=Singulisphaera sp. GP187 TaxID=1882752 RepID=UPI00092A3666|nr:fumarylacetoacetate hydrolase family protein [Singulisphaera sp. GP187]SIO31480.1 2-keto-4-pentenoate hydratase [Singulisphaera sp. GP187]
MVAGLQELARRMLAEYDARTPGRGVDNPLDLTTVQAYALQAEIARLRTQRGERVIGYKVGCTSRAIQTQLGVNEPIFGRLFDTECHLNGVHLSPSRYANLAVEGELAVRLSKDLPSQPLSAEECREAIADLFPVIELHHFVLPATWSPGPWLIASGGMHAGFVRAETETSCSNLAYSARSLRVRINEVVVGAVEDAAAPICPIESLRWLAGRLAQFGRQLCKGQVILTGSPMRLFPVAPGSHIVVEALPLGASCVVIDP